MENVRYIHIEETHNTKAAEEVLPFLFKLLNPQSVIDVGCGTGSWLAIAKKLGAKKSFGIDGVAVQRSMLRIDPKDFRQHDLCLPLNLDQRFDLAICLEVAEHLPEQAADNIVDVLSNSSDVILFSAAIPGQGGQNHINEQWPEYWQQKFKKKGYLAFDLLRNKFWGNNNVEWWYRQNMIIYAKESFETVLGPATGKLMPSIHPLLFEDKVNALNYANKVVKDRVLSPKFWPSLKLLIKSLTSPKSS